MNALTPHSRHKQDDDGQAVTDGHEVSLRVSRQDYALRILNEIDAGNGASQRSLARRVGIALGLTNIVLKDLVRLGWVRVSNGDRPIRYVITPEGLTERQRISTARLARTTRYYVETRDRVHDRLVALSTGPHTTAERRSAKRIALYGATEVAEIAYVCLQDLDLVVTAVFDGDRTRHFFGTAIRPLADLANPALWNEFDVLLVTAVEDSDRTRARDHVRGAAFPPERVFWL